MNIYIDGRLLDLKRNTGISRYSEFIINYYIFKGHKVSVILNDIANKIPGSNPILTNLKPYNIFDFHKYYIFIKSLPFDILHIPFYSGLCSKLHSEKKVIITIHDLMYKIVPDFFGQNILLNYLKKTYFDYIVKKSLKNSDLRISVSETTKHDTFQYFNYPSIVIPEHSELSITQDDTILKKHNLCAKGYYLYCGNNRNHKNIDFLRNVFIKKHIDKPLVLAGNGHKNDVNIITTGIISDSELKSLYCNASAFIFPSSYEGFGLPVLESIFCHTPVICTDIPAFKEFKHDNIYYYKVNNTESFLDAVKHHCSNHFLENKSFYEKYSINHIYSLLDLSIQKLFS